jgi:hypothetical protein
MSLCLHVTRQGIWRIGEEAMRPHPFQSLIPLFDATQSDYWERHAPTLAAERIWWKLISDEFTNTKQFAWNVSINITVLNAYCNETTFQQTEFRFLALCPQFWWFGKQRLAFVGTIVSKWVSALEYCYALLAHPSCFGVLSTPKTAIKYPQSVHRSTRSNSGTPASLFYGASAVLLVMFGVQWLAIF